MSDEGLLLARFPVGIGVDLFTALGGLVDAALAQTGDLMLAASDAPETAAKLVLRSELTQRQVAEALREAARQVDPARTAEAAGETAAGTGDDDGVEVGHMRASDDGVAFGLGGETVDAAARELAARMVGVMIPAMDALGAGNYLAWDFRDNEQPWQRWELVIRRPDGKTPHQKQARYEQALREIADDPGEGAAGARGVARTALDEMRAPT